MAYCSTMVEVIYTHMKKIDDRLIVRHNIFRQFGGFCGCNWRAAIDSTHEIIPSSAHGGLCAPAALARKAGACWTTPADHRLRAGRLWKIYPDERLA